MLKTAMRQSLLELLRTRGPEKSVCPSEVVRRLYPDDWRVHMEEIRTVAYDLADDGLVLVTQRGQPVGRGASGPIRVSQGQNFAKEPPNMPGRTSER